MKTKIKIIVVSVLLFLFVVFTGGCLQFMEELGSITSPSLKVDVGDGKVNYWAVIVGIEDYESMTDLSYTIDDAVDMEDVLVSYSNWDSNNIELLTDEMASKNGIDTAIANMALEADTDDVCLFFFSGHGSRIPDVDGDEEGIEDYYDEVICPWDTTEELGNVISDDELGGWLTECKGNVVVILDTCMSGGFTKGIEETVKTVPNPRVPKDSIAKKHFGEGLVEHLKQRPISRDLNQPGYVVLMACEEDKSAYESRRLENGVFTYYIVEGLWGPADANSDNKVTAEEDFHYADPLVLKYKPTNQDPQLYDSYDGELPLVIASPPGAGTIAGNVTDVSTSLAIGGAKVAVEGTNLSATTDANGDYTITDVAEGTYTVTASADGYENASQDVTVIADTTTLNVDFTLNPLPATGTTMHVSNIDMSFKIARAGPNTFYTAVATVTIVDSGDNPVEGATVYGQWSGATNDTDSGITDIYGQVSLESDKVKNPSDGTTFTFTVDDVIKDGYKYESSADVKTSDSIAFPEE